MHGAVDSRREGEKSVRFDASPASAAPDVSTSVVSEVKSFIDPALESVCTGCISRVLSACSEPHCQFLASLLRLTGGSLPVSDRGAAELCQALCGVLCAEQSSLGFTEAVLECVVLSLPAESGGGLLTQLVEVREGRGGEGGREISHCCTCRDGQMCYHCYC